MISHCDIVRDIFTITHTIALLYCIQYPHDAISIISHAISLFGIKCFRVRAMSQVQTAILRGSAGLVGSIFSCPHHIACQELGNSFISSQGFASGYTAAPFSPRPSSGQITPTQHLPPTPTLLSNLLAIATATAKEAQNTLYTYRGGRGPALTRRSRPSA